MVGADSVRREVPGCKQCQACDIRKNYGTYCNIVLLHRRILRTVILRVVVQLAAVELRQCLQGTRPVTHL